MLWIIPDLEETKVPLSFMDLQVPWTVFIVIFPFCPLKPFVLKTVFAHAFFCMARSAVKFPIQVLCSSVPVSSWFSSVVSVSLLLFLFNSWHISFTHSYTFHFPLFLVASLQGHLCCYCWDFGI